MDGSATTLVVKVIDEYGKAIKITSENIISLNQIKLKFGKQRNLTEEELKYLLFWYEDEDGDKYYIENDKDILSSAKEISYNYLLSELYSEIIKEKDNSINDNSQNQKKLENINNSEKNINSNNSYDFGKNEIDIKENEYQDNKYEEIEEMLNVKNKYIESLEEEISKLEKENKKLVRYKNNNNQINNDNNNIKNIENSIFQLLEKHEKIYKKFDELKSVLLNKLGNIIQEINKTKTIQNNNTAILDNNDNKIKENKDNENKDNGKGIKLSNSTENIINENNINEISNEENTEWESVMIGNKDNGKGIKENKINVNIINENIINEVSNEENRDWENIMIENKNNKKEIKENKINENIINEISNEENREWENIIIENKNNKKEIKENKKSLIAENKKNDSFIGENKNNDSIIVKNKNNGNKANKNKSCGNIIHENTDNKIKNLEDFCIITLKDIDMTNYPSEKKRQEMLEKKRKQLSPFNKFLKKLFFNEDGTANLKTYEQVFNQKKLRKIFKELEKCYIDPIEYFERYNQYFLQPILNNPEVKENLKTKISLFSFEINKKIRKNTK